MPMTSACTPFSMFACPELRTDDAFVGDGNGRGQRAAAQQQRGFARLVHGEAGGLEAVAEDALDAWRR